jgi:hypothetical protein
VKTAGSTAVSVFRRTTRTLENLAAKLANLASNLILERLLSRSPIVIQPIVPHLEFLLSRAGYRTTLRFSVFPCLKFGSAILADANLVVTARLPHFIKVAIA